jgi:hypothetical protein
MLCACAALLPVPALLAASGLPPLVSPPSGVQIQGKFTWFDLATTDPGAAQRFYGSVFGWKFEPLRGSPERYVIVRSEGRPIAGFFRPSGAPAGSTSSRWLSFASVADLGASLARLTAAGATVLVPATKLDGRGSHALLRDPQGAIFGLLQSAAGDPPDQPIPAGNFFWVDLYTKDPLAAARMYADLGYQVSRDEVSGDDRILLSASGHARVGIMKLPDPSREAGLLPYVQVEDVPATLARVRAAGGRVLREPDPAVLQGQLAVFADPQGGILGVISWPEIVDAAR